MAGEDATAPNPDRLTDGTLVWDGAAADFDWQRTTALPDCLRGWFADEPLWVDLRPVVAAAHGGRGYSTSDPLFLDAVATIASAVQHRPKDELIGDDIRKYRSARRFRRLSWSGLSVLTVAALVAAVLAVIQRTEAQTQTKVALGQKLVAQAEATRADHPRESLKYGLAANATDRTPAIRAAVQQTLTQSYYAGSILDHRARVERLLYTPDGHTIISMGVDGRLTLSDAAHRTSSASCPSRTTRSADSPGLNRTPARGRRREGLVGVGRHRLGPPPAARNDAPRASVPNDGLDIKIVFRPPSTDLAIADEFTSVSLWSLATPTQPKRFATIPTACPVRMTEAAPPTGWRSLQKGRR